MQIDPRARACRWRGLARFVLFCTILWIPGRAQPEALPDTQAVAVPATARAINYRNLTGSTEIGLRGTILMSQALGGAKVQNRGGAMSVKAWFKGMEPATKFGPEYLTYVLWAVTPVGRPVNLGEVIVRKSGRAKLEARTNLQTFGLIVTAEPHFAVSRVSSLVVLENAVTGATRGQVEEAEVRYERLPRSAYGQPGTPVASVPDRKISPYVRQAVNAFAIARGVPEGGGAHGRAGGGPEEVEEAGHRPGPAAGPASGGRAHGGGPDPGAGPAARGGGAGPKGGRSRQDGIGTDPEPGGDRQARG